MPPMNDYRRARLTRWLCTTQLPIPYPVQTWVLDALVGSRLTRVHLPSAGIELELDLADILQANIYLDRVWDQKLSNWLAFFAPRAQTMADVGAHIGYFTMLMSRYAPPNASIHAFEPTPRAFAQLKRNMELNGFAGTLNQVAVAAANGQHEFSLPHRFQLAVARLGRLTHLASTITVETVSLDRYCERRGLAGLDLIKMDIEGGEAEALPGMTDGLKAGVYGAILMDLHATILSPAQVQVVYDQLSAVGYYLYEIRPDRLIPSRNIRTGVDYHFCALSPYVYAGLGTPPDEFPLPADARLPFPIPSPTKH
jgi:FkbM family methyltransferase